MLQVPLQAIHPVQEVHPVRLQLAAIQVQAVRLAVPVMETKPRHTLAAKTNKNQLFYKHLKF